MTRGEYYHRGPGNATGKPASFQEIPWDAGAFPDSQFRFVFPEHWSHMARMMISLTASGLFACRQNFQQRVLPVIHVVRWEHKFELGLPGRQALAEPEEGEQEGRQAGISVRWQGHFPID